MNARDLGSKLRKQRRLFCTGEVFSMTRKKKFNRCQVAISCRTKGYKKELLLHSKKLKLGAYKKEHLEQIG